ncbi:MULTISPECIES: thioredoxin family protein [unclassified Modestobacter]|uniref:thioredoxin family protein n=1 Tax=unclassified Modestobacter TaxID=2643866 RepID=UPI0022AB1FBB|nr:MULTISPECIES: thioredoxin family protein [unclassified Modestobacter]MCZ2825234.1 thioredoxin family protein [Modestobacter sp. VKM Ac-2981]MCZ2853701.1 thioredoxin family protein [Modestobacter sp. VKM Ac-2982]
MDVALLYFDGCPNWTVADARLRDALAEIGCGEVQVEHRVVSTPEEAEAAEFRGSPTVLVNGQDPFLDRDSPVGLSCRVYRTADGLAGSPTVRQLIGVLREAVRSSLDSRG